MSRMRIDLHSHTTASWDGLMSPETLVRQARAVGLDRIAVTDHNTLAGALAAQALDPELIIVSEEISCAGGVELIGLFLERPIARGLPPEEAAARIREQGGLVYVPHPFAYLRETDARAERLLALADAVEAFNARAFLPRWNRRARTRALELGLPALASSDAHRASELGRAWTEVAPFTTAAELRAVLSDARPVGRAVGSAIDHVITVSAGWRRRWRTPE